MLKKLEKVEEKAKSTDVGKYIYRKLIFLELLDSLKDFETLKLKIVSFSSVRSRYSCAEFGRESYLPWWEDNGHWEWEWDSERRENKNRDGKRGSTAADSGMHYITATWFFFLKNIASVTCRCPDSFPDVVTLSNLLFSLYL